MSDSTSHRFSDTGSYSPVSIAGEDRSILFLGAANTLYYPNAAMTIKACRAYFQLNNGLTAGDPTNGVRTFNLNFGDGEASGITTTDYTNYTESCDYSGFHRFHAVS